MLSDITSWTMSEPKLFQAETGVGILTSLLYSWKQRFLVFTQAAHVLNQSQTLKHTGVSRKTWNCNICSLLKWEFVYSVAEKYSFNCFLDCKIWFYTG